MHRRRSGHRNFIAFAALLAAGLLLWLPPRLVDSQSGAGTQFIRSAPVQAFSPGPTALPLAKKSRRPRPAQSAPADTIFDLSVGRAASRAHVVALDEIYLPGQPSPWRAVPPAADLATHLARLSLFTPASSPGPSSGPDDLRHSAAPRLVLYPIDGPRDARTRRAVTSGLVVTLSSADAPTPAPRPELGIVAWERPAYAPSQAIARVAGDAAQPLRAAQALGARPLLMRELEPAFVPAAGLFPKQWHLRNTGQGGGRPGIDLKAVPAWDTATGQGVVVGILDSPIDGYHSDLSPRRASALDHDWTAGASESSFPHGTAVAGLAVAGGDYAHVVGLAHNARFTSLTLLGLGVTDEDVAEAFAWKNETIAIKNNSWGPPGAPAGLADLDPVALDALASAANEGRGGAGVIFVVGSGNSRPVGDQGSKNALATARQALAIGALARTGSVASFSEDGPHLLALAPGVELLTTDRTGDSGYIDTSHYPYEETQYLADYVFFTGTSASAPLASGLCALLLEIRPDLGWRDVKEILLRSSTRLSPDDAGWTARSGNRPSLPAIHHHHRYGAGLLNARKALELARDWPCLPAEEALVAPAPSLALPATIPDGRNAKPVSLIFEVPADQPFRIEHVSLTLSITHPFRGDLDIQLRSPSGVVSRLATPTFADDGNDYPGWIFTSVRHWGELAAGPWTLTIRDAHPDDIGTLDAASLVFHGITPQPAALDPYADQPVGGTYSSGSSYDTRVNALGLDLLYTWYRGETKIAAGRDPAFRIKALSARDAGAYRCVVSNPWGSVTTEEFQIVIDDTPLFSTATHVGVLQEIDLAQFLDQSGGWKISNLPPGLRYDRETGWITGIMRGPGDWTTALTAVIDGRVVRHYLRFTSATYYAENAGRYQGLLYPDGTEFNQGLGGLYDLTLTTRGRYTGTIRLGSFLYPVSGRLINGQGEGETYAKLTLPAKRPLPALLLSFTAYGDGGNGFEISVAAQNPEAYLYAFGGKNTPEPAFAGAYAFTLGENGIAFPDGTAAGRFSVDAKGEVVWELSDADNNRLYRGSSLMTPQGYFSLYCPTGAPRGEIAGPVSVGPDDYGPLVWRATLPSTEKIRLSTHVVPVTAP